MKHPSLNSTLWAGALLMASTLCQVPAASAEGKISLLDAAPQAWMGFKRYPKYYGDPNMDRAAVDGSLSSRPYLLGSLGGVRDSLAERGLVVDAGVTQVLQGVASGDGGGSRYVGSADLWLALDSGRADLWSGGLVVAHIEGNWGRGLEGTGALLPTNGDAIMPSTPSSFSLSELYLLQGLPAGFSVVLGKVDWSGIADKSLFANDERNQFLHEGLVNDVVLGSFVPYTALGVGVVKEFTKTVQMALVGISNNDSARSSGFDTLSASEFTYGLALSWTPTLGGLPASYNALLGYSTKAVPAFDVDERYLLGELTRQVPVADKPDNYAFTLAGSQYFTVNRSAKRADGQPVGIGGFVRVGMQPEDRSAATRTTGASAGPESISPTICAAI